MHVCLLPLGLAMWVVTTAVVSTWVCPCHARVGYTYAIKPWGFCDKQGFTTMFAWCDPIEPDRFNYCCGVGCQRFRCPRPANKPPKEWNILPKVQPEYIYGPF
jgi:hypothetical protein